MEGGDPGLPSHETILDVYERTPRKSMLRDFLVDMVAGGFDLNCLEACTNFGAHDFVSDVCYALIHKHGVPQDGSFVPEIRAGEYHVEHNDQSSGNEMKLTVRTAATT